MHTHGALVRHTYNLTFHYGVTNDSVMFTAMPFFWVGGLITGLHAVIHHGATLITQPAFDAAEALELIEAHRATITLGWPQQGKTLAEHPDFAQRDLSSVIRTSMPAMVPPDRRPTGPNALGMTELCGNHVGVDPYVPQPPERSETGGLTIDGLEHLVVDPESGEPVPIGTSGEIWVRGYSLMQRLYKREREDVFTPDGYYRTGDCGVQAEDGWITFTGRLGDLIKTGGGTNVTPAEVELALTNCDGVLEAYVVGAQDGDHGTVVAAAVVPRGASVLDGDALKAQLRSQISAYKVPKFIWVADKDAAAVHCDGQDQEVRLGRSAERAAGRAVTEPHHGRLVVSKVNGIPNNGSNFTSVTSNPSPATCCRKSDLAPQRNAMCSAASQSAVRTTTENKPSPLRARKSAAVPASVGASTVGEMSSKP